MHIITRSAPSVESKNWRQVLSESVREPKTLLLRLGLNENDVPHVDLNNPFATLVPEPFIGQMRYGDAYDPLLRQVLPLRVEQNEISGFSQDPLGEREANVGAGVVHKYHGRLLLMLASGCAINCRYCFRRHFPYSENRLSKENWQKALSYIQKNTDLSEVILSGGEPLLVADERLEKLIQELENISHIKRLRIHTRLPVVIPQRLTSKLKRVLDSSRFGVTVVLHCNHQNEISQQLEAKLLEFKNSGITLLNQSVLLQGVNDNEQALVDLSERLFTVGVLPYYLHLLDSVKGAAHFSVKDEAALMIYENLQKRLPGYLVPKLVREQAGEAQKTLLIP